MTAGPSIVADIKNSGYTVEESYYVDDALPQGGFGGFQDLVTSMRAVRDKYISQGTRVVVVAHSHGGVWAHAAIRQVSDLPITAEIDLDTSSYGWSIVSHNLQNSFIGGDPRNEFTINFLSHYSQYNVPSENSSSYDIEDVVFRNVKSALEVRSGEIAPLGLEWYDEKWNIREDGTTTNLYGYFSNTSHNEVHQPGGSTIAFVKNWLRIRLSGTP